MPAPNGKWRPPKIAMTPRMMAAGLDALKQIVDGGDEHTDDALVAAVFINMWAAYWADIEAVARKKTAGAPLITPQKPKGLILPPSLK